MALAPTIGLVGPMSNYAPPAQLVETVPYRIGPKRGAAAGEAGASDFLVPQWFALKDDKRSLLTEADLRRHFSFLTQS